MEILRDSRDCFNVKYNSVITLPNNTEEIMYIRTEYFYDENDNYLDKHQLVRYNINTQVEEVVVN
jgi:hypothetical protein